MSISAWFRQASPRFWAWTTKSRPHWTTDPVEGVICCTVFAITGTGSVQLVRPALKSVTGIEGNMIEGPWSYRITSLVSVTPIYATVLTILGTLSGRHVFFAGMAQKIVGRLCPPLKKQMCEPATLKRAAEAAKAAGEKAA
mmetsp:Transcript_3246/g.7302  ORF Transcript_3246/g.7302 Transcript_3246/m.7302 type:complete len:141 (+) Transcript_3246:38-460(+)